MIHVRRTTCRACDSAALERFLDLGLQPLANAFPAAAAEFAGEARYPLEVWFCRDCALAQLVDVIDPVVLFGHYLYMTGMSSTMDVHNVGYARAIVDAGGLGPDDLVVEVASNDGSLLLRLAELGVRTLGVEPAANLAEVARGRGVETLTRFFDKDAARTLVAERGHAACVVGNNVFAHVDDPRGFLAGMALVAGEKGRVVFEVPYLGHLLDRFEYDTVYHEHLSYFSVTALAGLCTKAGVRIDRIEDVAVHGGSLRVWGRRAGAAPIHETVHAPEVERRVAEEEKAGLAGPARFHAFAADVAEHRRRLRSFLSGLKARGARIAAYGAPAKGNTLLNYCGIGPETIEFVVDRNPLKAGRFTPGTHLPVLFPEAILEKQPDYVLILPWNIAPEIVELQAEYVRRGGRFIVPIPEPAVLN